MDTKENLQTQFIALVRQMQENKIDFPDFDYALCVKQHSDRYGTDFYVSLHSTLELANAAKGEEEEEDGKYWEIVRWCTYERGEPIGFTGEKIVPSLCAHYWPNSYAKSQS